MQKRQFKSQASSGRAGGAFGSTGFGNAGFGTGQSSTLSYVQEPPDYSAIDDPNLVVALKNLSKKDGTTKARALEDVSSIVGAQDTTISDGLLEFWAKSFPRLSIDTTRRVRQLAHTLNGQICSKAGKRTVKHMPKIAGPWLAGTFDNDRAVSRAASDALKQVFPTAEKVHGVRRAFQRPIMEYCRDALLVETVSTLSDERTVTADDAKSAHARVVATALSVVSDLLNDLQHEDRQKDSDLYEEILHDAKFWNFVNDDDSGVRRSICRLIRNVDQIEPTVLAASLNAASTSFVYKGLHSEQTGSATDFTLTLKALAVSFPSIWTDAYTGKKPAISRLRHFLKQGSQASSTEYWQTLQDLFKVLPQSLLPKELSEVKELLDAMRVGVRKKEERFNASSAWPAYFTLMGLCLTNSDENGESILEEHAMPIVRQFLFPSPETEAWDFAGPKPAPIISTIASLKGCGSLLEKQWPKLADELLDAARVSQPEQSKDFTKSQINVAAAGERFAVLQKEMWTRVGQSSGELSRAFISTSTHLLNECISLLKTRNGKPFGAAAVIAQLLKHSHDRLMATEEFSASYQAFLDNDMSDFIYGPSQSQLIQGLYAIVEEPNFPTIFEKLLRGITTSTESRESAHSALRTMFSTSTPQPAVEVARRTDDFQSFIAESVTHENSGTDSTLLPVLIRQKVATDQTVDAIMAQFISSLNTGDRNRSTLSAIDELINADGRAVNESISRSNGAADQLLPSLMRLEQSPDDTVAEKASALVSQLSSALSEGSSQGRFRMILQNLDSISQKSMTIGSVLDLARQLLETQGGIEKAEDVLPNMSTWQTALQQVIETPPPSTALLSPFLGAVHFLDRQQDGAPSTRQFDGEGYSQALRIAMYVGMLFTEFNLIDKLEDQTGQIVAFMQITMQVAGDNLSISGSNGLWNPRNSESIDNAVIELTSDFHKALKNHLNSVKPAVCAESSSDSGSFYSALEYFGFSQGDLSATAYYAAIATAKISRNYFEIHGASSTESTRAEEILRSHRKSGELLRLMTDLVGYQRALTGTPLLTRYCNELVADLTGLNPVEKGQAGMQKLVVLNCILWTQEEAAAAIAKQRLIFLVKHLIPWLDADISQVMKAEVCKLLSQLLPPMADMYGEHWEQILTFLVGFWNASTRDSESAESQEGQTLFLNASLRLYGTVEKLSKSEEVNEDLAEAFKDRRDSLRDGLVNLLKTAEGKSDGTHQPLSLTYETLSRQISATAYTPLKDLDELFPLMYTPSKPIQQGAFNLLHRQIPAAQEQISFDAALDNTTAHLPEELLSLLLEAPTLNSLVDESFDRSMPSTLRGYLFSWRLLFDHFNGSSYKVKSDYIEQLKDGTYLPDLLNFTFDFLGLTNGKPVDVSKFDMESYIADNEPSPEKDVQWLLIHLYFLVLKHLPSLAKTYYLELRSRQTSSTVESWTAKHFTSVITAGELKDVAEWATKTIKDDRDYENLNVRVGMKSKEVNVTYEIDEQTMAIKVVLPAAYPLASAQVVGVNRVAVREEKWQSWLRNCLGVITFSVSRTSHLHVVELPLTLLQQNGSIIDGLIAWHNNVSGALKGQSECAICYSIISAAKELPTKRCQTCKNLFHSSCLFKWFKKSNASTCPLCRTAFNFN